MRNRHHLQKFQRPKESGFKPGKSKTGWILALCVLVGRWSEVDKGCSQPMLLPSIESVHCEPLWDFLRSYGIPTRIVDLVRGLYAGTESAVECAVSVSGFRFVYSVVRQ